MRSRSNGNPTSRILKFGNCHLDKVERKVYKNGKPVEIAPRSFDVLQLLAEKSGEILTKDAILEQVWTDSFVEEGNLAVHISRLRKLLGANKSEPLIETVSGIGYRFVSRVRPIDEDVWELQLLNDPAFNAAAAASDAAFDSIAVLPLINETCENEVEYLAEGLTESIINNLSYMPGLRVLARNTVFRFKGEGVDIVEVGKKLGVAAILTGRLRVIQDNLIISVELSDASNAAQIWGNQFNEPFRDIFELQERITESILTSLASRLGAAANKSPASRVTENTESYRSYLKGKYLLNKRSINDIHKAIECFQHSISLDPTNAHAYIELANSNRLLYSYDQRCYADSASEIRAFLTKASEINHLIPDLFALRGIIELYFNFNFVESERNLRKALILNPNLTIAHRRLARLCVYQCRFADALIHVNESIKLDPFSLESNKYLARIFYFSAQFENAIFKLEECLELEPEDFQTYLLLGINLVELKKYEDAESALQKSLDLQFHFETLAMIGYSYSQAGKYMKARKILNRIEKSSKKTKVAPSYMGILCASLGEIDRAFFYIDRALEDHDADIIGLQCDPRWKSLKNDPRFYEVLEKIGFQIEELK